MLKNSKSAGGILLMSLVIFGMFSIMMIVSVNYINRQFKSTIHDEHQSRAFQIAEAGVHYSLWLLGEEVYGEDTPQYLHDLSTPIQDDVPDPVEPANTMGRFFVTYEKIVEDTREKMIVTSSGQDHQGRSECETIVATVRQVQDSTGGEKYAITAWDHLVGCSYEE